MPTENISVTQGYRAMFKFLEAYWERGGRTDDGIASLLGSMNFSEGESTVRPLDPAQWQDWLDAVKAVQ